MARPFRKTYSKPIPGDAIPCTVKVKRRGHESEVSGVRFKGPDGRTATAPLTARGDRILIKNPVWYGYVAGVEEPLCEDKTAAESMLADLRRKADRDRAGLGDPFADHGERPIGEHVDEWEASLRTGEATDKHILHTVRAVRRVVEGCGLERLRDLTAAPVENYLDGIGRPGEVVVLDDGKKEWKKKEVAALLGVGMQSVTNLVSLHRLTASGNGKARRFPRATVEALLRLRARGKSIRTRNFMVGAVKTFTGWLVERERLAQDPLASLKRLNAEVDKRHTRRELTVDELRGLLVATRSSRRSFRRLSGEDRFLLYATGCGTGLRAGGLASLIPESFQLDREPPTVTLGAKGNKTKKTKVLPLPADIAALLRTYLAGKPAGQPVWPGKWIDKPAELLRKDLKAAGIPYQVNGPEGPEYADFHALRHTYLTMGGEAGIDLRTLQELAGHSDPKLTARYSHRRMAHLAAEVGKLPDFLPGSGGET